MAAFEVWIEGYAATGENSPARRLLKDGETVTQWEGISFQQACVKALNELNWDMLYTGAQGCGSSYYDIGNNSYWGCRFFDNEVDARKSFG